MSYVQRDANGAIVGIFANPQPQADGSVLTDPTPLDDMDPEILAFFSARKNPNYAASLAIVPKEPTAQDVIDVLKKKGLVSDADFQAVAAPAAL